MEMEMKVIVIGGNHHNTLGVVRSLGYKGLKSHVIIVSRKKNPYVCYSKYIVKYKVVSTAEEIVEYLLSMKNYYINSVVISCADFVTAVLDAHQSLLSNYYKLPVGGGNIGQVMNKDIMAFFANKCGIITPRNLQIEEVSFDSCKKFILKPLKSIEGSKKDIAIVSTKAELDSYLSSVHCSNLQIQEFIEKELEFQLIGCSLNGGEKVIIPGASIILRQPENTNTGFLKYVGFEKFKFDGYHECEKFIRTIGYSGLFSMEFLRGKDGKDYFMEINMRNDGNAICVTASGVNLPYIWYCHCIKSEEWIQEASNRVREILVMPEFDDFVNVIKHKISLFQWIKDIYRTDCFMEYDKRDTKPFYHGLLQQLSNYVKLVLKKVFYK